MMKKFVFMLVVLATSSVLLAQTHLDQNGLKTSVISAVSLADATPKRFEIAKIGYNSYHWQSGGIVIIELFSLYYETSYARYIVEVGFGQGGNYGNPVLKLAEVHGIHHNGRLMLGAPADMGINDGGYPNKVLPIYLDLKDYAQYRIKFTYGQGRVDNFSTYNQIKIDLAPTGTNIAAFTAPAAAEIPLRTNSAETSFLVGSLGIGISTPTEKLDVNGKIRSKEIKVQATGWPDFVFEKDYQNLSLDEIETYIQKNKRLPEMPSAKEVEKEGIALGEMNKLLLKKIEELTLHVIQLHKELGELKQAKQNN